MRTQLMFEAFDGGNEALASFWIETGVRLTARHRGKTIFQLAVSHQWPTVIERLIERGAGTSNDDVDGETLLLQAIREGANLELFKMLIVQLKEDVNAVDSEMGETSLHLAARLNRADLIELLIQHQKDPMTNELIESQDENGFRPLHSAMRSSHDVIDLLLSHGAQLESRTRSGMTPLHVAVIENEKDAVQQLLSWGANLSTKDEHGCTPIDYAAPHPDVERILNNSATFRQYHAALPSSKRRQQ